MSRNTQARREQRGHREFLISPTVSARYAKPNTGRIWAIAIVIAVLLGPVSLLIARALTLALWGAA